MFRCGNGFFGLRNFVSNFAFGLFRLADFFFQCGELLPKLFLFGLGVLFLSGFVRKLRVSCFFTVGLADGFSCRLPFLSG